MRISCLIAVSCLLLAPSPTSAQSQKLHKVETSKASLEKLLKRKISMPTHMSAKRKAEVKEVVAQITKGDLKVAKSKWTAVVEKLPRNNLEKDIGTLMLFVMREAYQQSLEDLNHFAEKVKYFNEAKKQIREELTEVRNFLSDGFSDGKGQNKVAKKLVVSKFDGNIPTFVPGKKLKLRSTRTELNREEVDAYIEQLEQMLATVGDDAQLANIDLQNNLQKAQQVLQTMSNVSKMLHDTSMSIIRKIG